PTNPNVIFIGGDREPGPDDGVSFPNASGSKNYTGRILRGTMSGAGATWEAVVANGAGGTAPHAGSRAMVFNRDGDLLAGDDGGLYRLNKADVAAERRWSSVNGNLAAAQLSSVAYDVGRDVVIAGTQDAS